MPCGNKIRKIYEISTLEKEYVCAIYFIIFFSSHASLAKFVFVMKEKIEYCAQTSTHQNSEFNKINISYNENKIHFVEKY